MKLDLFTLKSLSYNDLEYFSKELRDYIKIVIKKIGGHYASPLGTVGITVAAHYIFNSPEDSIVFDTGHQCYAHKIITGRVEEFKTIRQVNSISGFPDPSESYHDHFCVGHAGTALAIAMGLSIKQSDNWVVAIIGDSAFANGITLESLLLIHHSKRPIIIIVNDNRHSIADAVSSLRIKNSSRYEALAIAAGISFAGSIEGNEAKDLAIKLNAIKELGKSCLLHVCTKKGFSDVDALLNPFKYHSIQPFIVKNQDLNSKTPQSELSNILKNLAHQTRLFFVSMGMAEVAGFIEIKAYKNIDYLDVGIAEHSGITIAAVASKNFDYTFIHIYSTFLQRATDALLHDIGVNKSSVILLIDRCGLAGEDGPTHHGIYDLSILKSCPNIEIYSCATDNYLNTINKILSRRRNNPLAIRISKGKLVDSNGNNTIHLKKGLLVHRYGHNLTIVSHGRILEQCLKASDILEQENIKCRVIELIKLHPISLNTINYLKSLGPVLIVEEHIVNGSIGSTIKANWDITENLTHLFINNELTKHGNINWQWKINKLDAESIVEVSKSIIKDKNYLFQNISA